MPGASAGYLEKMELKVPEFANTVRNLANSAAFVMYSYCDRVKRKMISRQIEGSKRFFN